MSYPARMLTGMHTIELWRWRVTDPVTGRRYTTRYVLTEADALERFTSPQREEHSQERREVPDGPHEFEYTNPQPHLALRWPPAGPATSASRSD